MSHICVFALPLVLMMCSSYLQDLLNKRWYEVAEKIAREKVGQALRDAINQKEQQKGSGGKEEESNRSVQKRRRLTGEDDYEGFRPFPNFFANPTSDVDVSPPASAISLMIFQNQQDVATMMNSPLQLGGGVVRRKTAARMEEVYSKMISTKRGASTFSSSISSSKDYQSLEPPCRRMVADHHQHQRAFPPVAHHDDNRLMPEWSFADLEPRPLAFPSCATYKEGNIYINSAGAVPDEYHQKERRACQNDDPPPEETKSFYF